MKIIRKIGASCRARARDFPISRKRGIIPRRCQRNAQPKKKAVERVYCSGAVRADPPLIESQSGREEKKEKKGEKDGKRKEEKEAWKKERPARNRRRSTRALI
jgi:hypothetical protein